jgi:hypothetical protein
MPLVDVEELRALLARRRITHRAFAEACDLSIPYMSRILVGSAVPGRLGRLQLMAGLERLGLDQAVQHG